MKDTSWYRVGTISVANGSGTVSGAGVGSWVKNVSVGDVLLLGNTPYRVDTVADGVAGAGTLTISPNYSGADIVNGSYAIIRSYTDTTPAELAARVAEMLQVYHVTFDQLISWMTGGGDGSVETVTLQDFAGVSGLTVPTLPRLAPLQLLTSVTAAPNKIPKAGSDGKLDPNWLPAELVNKILNAGTSTGDSATPSSTVTTDKLVQLLQSGSNSILTLHSGTARVYDVFITYADHCELRLNYVNTAPQATDPIHTGVPATAALKMVVRLINTTSSSVTLTWSGMPVIWEEPLGQLSTIGPGDVAVVTLRWLSSANLIGVTLPTAFNNWVACYNYSQPVPPA